MTPADQDFQRVIRLVSSAVINRRAAIEYGGATGRTLQRLASQRITEADELMRGLVGANPAHPKG
jgi:hypothetical protein